MGYSKSFYNSHPDLVDSTMDYLSVFTGDHNIWATDSKGHIRWLRLLCDENKLRRMLQNYITQSTSGAFVLENLDHGQMIASLLFASGQQIWDMTYQLHQ
jgi:hypothetical protein